MNDLNSRLSYIKMMVNSYYGTNISKIYEESINIKRKIHPHMSVDIKPYNLIEKRKFKIKFIFKK